MSPAQEETENNAVKHFVFFPKSECFDVCWVLQPKTHQINEMDLWNGKETW